MPGTFTRQPVQDPWKSEGWFYEALGLYFDSHDRVDGLSVNLYEERPLPNWFVDWFPTSQTTIGALKLYLRERRIPVWDILWDDRDHWLLMGTRACASGFPYRRNHAGIIAPDERYIADLISYRDISDLPFLSNPYDRSIHKT